MHFAIATAQVYIASPKAIGNSIVNNSCHSAYKQIRYLARL